MPIAGEHHPAFEEYCECIFELMEDGFEVIQARIVERLRVSRPSVSEMCRRMEKEGLITLDGPRIHLTAAGQDLAERVVRKHRLAERFITEILGLSFATAHREAGRWEHVMSDEIEAAMNRVLGGPTTCPHGNPIPGANALSGAVVRLGEIKDGSDFTVKRIPEELEFTPGMLEFLETNGIVPGSSGRIVSRDHDGTRVVEVRGTKVTVDSYAVSRIFVEA